MSQGVVFAQGSVDDTRVYSKVADAGELGLLSVSHAAMGTPPSSLAPARQQGGCTTVPARLAGWWLGDGNPNDTVGGKHGIPENGATYAGGIVGEAFSLDGVDDFHSIEHRPVRYFSRARHGCLGLPCQHQWRRPLRHQHRQRRLRLVPAQAGRNLAGLHRRDCQKHWLQGGPGPVAARGRHLHAI